jgi:DHA3 family macrolide efflux protein-like MFS transporter
MTADSKTPRRWGWTFFPIWGGGALSWVGSTIAQFALVWWLTDVTGSVAVLAAATTISLLPQSLLGPLAGAYVDRWNRRLIMIAADGLIALLALWLVWLIWQESLAIWHVYAIMVMRALGGIFHHPAMHAATAMMVPQKELARVQGLNQALGGAVNVIGPPLGALAMSVLALHEVMFIDVITAIVAILPLLWARIPEPARKPTGVGARAIVNDMLEGLRYVRSFPGMLAVIGVAVGLNFVGSPTWTLLPLYVRNVFGGDAAALGMVQSAFGVGLICGGLLLTAWGGFRSRVKTGFGAFVLMGVALVMMGNAPAGALWVVAASWFVFALFSAIGNGLFAALLQTAVAPEMQGRVLSVVSSGVQMAIPLGLALATPAAEAFGLRPLYIGAGVLSALGSLWALSSRAVRRLDEAGASEEAATVVQAEPEGVEVG